MVFRVLFGLEESEYGVYRVFFRLSCYGFWICGFLRRGDGLGEVSDLLEGFLGKVVFGSVEGLKREWGFKGDSRRDCYIWNSWEIDFNL